MMGWFSKMLKAVYGPPVYFDVNEIFKEAREAREERRKTCYHVRRTLRWSGEVIENGVAYHEKQYVCDECGHVVKKQVTIR